MLIPCAGIRALATTGFGHEAFLLLLPAEAYAVEWRFQQEIATGRQARVG